MEALRIVLEDAGNATCPQMDAVDGRDAHRGGGVWALDGYIGGFSEMPPVNSQIPGDTRWK